MYNTSVKKQKNTCVLCRWKPKSGSHLCLYLAQQKEKQEKLRNWERFEWSQHIAAQTLKDSPVAVSSYSESVGCIGSAQASIFQCGWLKEQTFTPQRTSFLKNCGQSECHIACVACVPCVACCVCSVCTFTASEFLHALQFPGVEALRSVGPWHLAHTGAFWSCGSHAGFLRFAHGASKWTHKITFVKSALNPPLWIHDMYIYNTYIRIYIYIYI